MPVHARVCFSLDWLAARLCELTGRTSVSQEFLMEVYTETVQLLECDLNSQTHQTSLNTALACALEMCGYPTCELNNAPQTSVSSKVNQEHLDQHRPGPAQ